ncbi:MAG TPA: D-glycero-beta-D-manno-heptose 1-phosphate adenylyltransferase [Chitinophagales bacterium]|nr:D-glycero-beta-D-manno-heptose 1-phosphate adenylyltransferase [Chitinophagales bacterium]
MNYLPIIEQKIMTVPELKRMIAVWRLKSKKVVFTNGCFDLIHAGHIHLLTTARSFGDVLIAALNTDASVSKLKPGRPLQDEQSRALIMASFDFIDAVILFDEETPYELIKALQPDVLVKGGDYTPDTVVGKDIVESNGGKVELVKYMEGFSTSNIISRIRGLNG